MISSRLLRTGAAILATFTVAAFPMPEAHAQQAYQGVLSGRGTSKVLLEAVVPEGTPAAQRPVSHSIAVDFGQPHARGRVIMGTVVPYGEVWRLGANEATMLTSTVDLSVGGQTVPSGEYSLAALVTANSVHLIVNRKTGPTANVYDAALDLVRVPMQLHTRSEITEALQISLEPTGPAAPLGGVLRVKWGTLDASVPYIARP